ncbi:hypothetical protein NE865_10714 [Phthorimaea operculella]|nr:hypothetical protein NE865_10714 [Phthorimaea operculella]
MVNAKVVPLKDDILLTNFIHKYVEPFVNAEPESDLILRSANSKKLVNQRNDAEYKEIIEYIVKKVEEFKPLLQDDTFADENRLQARVDEKLNLEGSDKLALQGDDETTIIEFIPKLRTDTKMDKDAKLIETKAKDFQDNLQKYKKLRSKIRKALKREDISKKTKNLITNTLDKMIAQMIAHSCTWKNGIKLRGLMENENQNSANIVKSWNEMWHKLKHQFKSANLTKKLDAESHKDLFLRKFQDLVSVMTSDLNTMVSKYKVECQLKSLDSKNDTNTSVNGENRPQNEKRYLRGNEDIKSGKAHVRGISSCRDFKICSEELTDFLLDFYINLNETTASTFNNYASMFLRDVNDDAFHEKERVVGLIKATSEATQKKIEIVFKKQLRKMKLDPNHTQNVNIQALNTFITNATRRVKKSAHKQIQLGLTSVRGKLMINIQKDVDVNLEYDLGKLEKQVKGKICELFVTCNGRVYSRKADYVSNNKNNVYVKVQLNLRDLQNGIETTTVESLTRYKQYRVMVTKSPLKYAVTRTTPKTRDTEKINEDYNNMIIKPYLLSERKMEMRQPKSPRRHSDFVEDPKVVTLKITMFGDKQA